jgi:hypothetical protein
MQTVIDWLLEKSQPAVRYAALTDLLDTSPRESEARETFEQIPLRGWASNILKEQLPGGYWHNYAILNRPKYVTTYWKFFVLADLGVTAKNEKMRAACELMSEERLSNKVYYHLCITANIVRSFLRAGYDKANRVRRAIDWLVEVQKEDGGWHCFDPKKGTLDCWEPLSAFAALPKQRWTRRVKKSAENGAEFYLERDLYKEGKGRYAPWFRYHYPVHYYYDTLVGLEVLTSLGYTRDKRMKVALEHLRNKKRGGRWNLDAIHPDLGSLKNSDYSFKLPWEPYPAIPFALEKAGSPSKIITVRALKVLTAVDGSL